MAKASPPVCVQSLTECLTAEPDNTGTLVLNLKIGAGLTCGPDGLTLDDTNCECNGQTVAVGGRYSIGLV